ncbi:unnamed protein product [Amoebophrya sp. A25]|nr:unnamed protein product [Amoebophrya sp. A25]|eukprot:GSA25T00018061001.1
MIHKWSTKKPAISTMPLSGASFRVANRPKASRVLAGLLPLLLAGSTTSSLLVEGAFRKSSRNRTSIENKVRKLFSSTSDEEGEMAGTTFLWSPDAEYTVERSISYASTDDTGLSSPYSIAASSSTYLPSPTGTTATALTSSRDLVHEAESCLSGLSNLSLPEQHEREQRLVEVVHLQARQGCFRV